MPVFITSSDFFKPVLAIPYSWQKRFFYALLFSCFFVQMLGTSIFLNTAHAQARCDVDKSCIGAALTLQQSTQVQYVDVRKTAVQNTLTTALTVEAWLNPTRQSGARQFIAGQWGPNADVNDVWLLAISANDELVFEVNGATTALGATDNTIVRASIASRYNTWFHAAAVFDGAMQTVRLYINGVEVAQSRNAMYPASNLRIPQNTSLLVQIGNSNALNNIGERNATYRGQMDEIRLWSRALTQSEIFCGQTRSLLTSTSGNENRLVLYYRCNEAASAVTLCDASNNGNTGDLRSGARCLAPTQTRTIPQVLAASPAQITETFSCDQVRTYAVQIRNIAPSCSEQVSVSISGADAGLFSIPTGQRFTLAPNSSTQATVRLQTNFTGDLEAMLSIARTNSCGDTLRVPIRVTRNALVQASVRSVTFATLFAGCREIPFLINSFSLRNTSSQPITLQSLASTRPQMFQARVNLPQVVPANGSVPITMLFAAAERDSAGLYTDTLRFRTSDPCQPELAVPVRGLIEEALVIRRGYGLARLDSVAFGRECPEGGISDPVDFTWESASSSATVRVDTVIYPAFVRGRSVRYPVLLRPNLFADPNFLRFAPVQAGFVRDSVIIRASLVPTGGPITPASACTFEKRIYVSGRGNALQTMLTPPSVNFGDVTIGQVGSRQVTLTNPSTEDTLRVSLYFRNGSFFALTGARGLTLLPRQTVMVPISFRPLQQGNVSDTLCIFEQRCFFTTCTSVQGRGVQATFQIDSAVKRIENVLGCQFRTDSVVIRNLTNTDQFLTNLSFTDQSGGRIQEFSGLISASVSMITIRANSSETFLFRYIPNDLTQDRTDAAFFRFQNGGQPWEIVIRASSVAPRLFATPVVAYGVVEVGDTRLDTVVVENLSQVPLDLTRLELPDGFSIRFQPRPFPTTLAPREQFRMIVAFAPTQDRVYSGRFRAVSASPCPTSIDGEVQGRGQVVRFELGGYPVPFGFTRPCDCSERRIPLSNPSFVNPMTVRRVDIDSANIPGGAPQLFSWTSLRSPSGQVPYQIPPNSADTVRVRYCPRIPAEDRFATSRARMLFVVEDARGQTTDSVILAGRRNFVFKPLPTQVSFTATLLDNDNLMPQSVALSIPSVVQNPTQQPVVIDSISFSPNQNVFRVLSPSFPIRLEPNAPPVTVRLGFRPRAQGNYQARMVIYQAEPCRDQDTTVLVSGDGFNGTPNPLRLSLSSSTSFAVDTLRTTTCGTLTVPIFAYTRPAIAATPRIITARIRFDTTAVRLVGVSRTDTVFRTQGITALLASSATIRATQGGVQVRIVTPLTDSLREQASVQFESISPRRAAFRMEIDSIGVVTSDTTQPALAPESRSAQVFIQETSIAALQPLPVQFDSVQILDCRRQDLSIRNTGDVAVRAISLVQLPPEVRIVASVPPLSDSLRAGQTLRLTLEYCPRTSNRIDTTLWVRSEQPCASATIATVTGRGVLTDLPVQFTLTTATASPQPHSIRGQITDTVNVPIVLNRDIAAQLRGQTFWLRQFGFTLRMRYSPYSLKYVDTRLVQGVKGRVAANSDLRQGTLTFAFADMDSLKAGTLAMLRFIVAVPDTLVSNIALQPDSASFRTDSLMFLRIRPQASTALFTTLGICDLTYLQFPKTGNALAELKQNAPNPASDKTSIEFELAETAPVRLEIYSAQGQKVHTVLSGQNVLQSGRYVVDVPTQHLAAGVYFYVLESAGFRATKAMVIVR